MSDVKLGPKSILFGKKRSEIVGILGPPDSDEEDFVTYCVGYMGETGYLEQPYHLILRFPSADDTLPEVVIVSD